MAVYEYTARDGTGNEFNGSYSDIDSVSTLRDELAKMGYELVKTRRKKKAAKKQRIKQADVVAFAYQFAGMCSAGLPIAKCLGTLEEQAENPAFKCVIAEVRQEIEAGSSLKKAFEKHRKLFSDFFLGMVEAGESASKLSEALNLSAEYLEKRMELKRKVRSAFAYPVFVGVVCLLVLTGLLVFVVPVFAKIYQQLHVTLPGPTLLLVGLSGLIRHRWWAILLAPIPVAFVLQGVLRSPLFRARLDAFKLNMPVFGRLNRLVVVSHFTRTFAMLVSVGVPLIKALHVASMVAHNHKITEIADELHAAIKAGNSVGSSLKKYDIFPPMIIQLATSGEEAGELAEMLNKGADFIDNDIDRTTNALLARLEPALTVVMGTVVGVILMAVYLPMFDYMQHLK
ncbi:MAG: type II secretion system F family protein [Planctomycetota bacterium]|jgi:type II secretory pathway component PulF